MFAITPTPRDSASAANRFPTWQEKSTKPIFLINPSPHELFSAKRVPLARSVHQMRLCCVHRRVVDHSTLPLMLRTTQPLGKAYLAASARFRKRGYIFRATEVLTIESDHVAICNLVGLLQSEFTALHFITVLWLAPREEHHRQQTQCCMCRCRCQRRLLPPPLPPLLESVNKAANKVSTKSAFEDV